MGLFHRRAWKESTRQKFVGSELSTSAVPWAKNSNNGAESLPHPQRFTLTGCCAACAKTVKIASVITDRQFNAAFPAGCRAKATSGSSASKSHEWLDH